MRDSYILEQLIIKDFSYYKYTPKTKFKGSGECFSKNPLDSYNRIVNYYHDNKIENDKMNCEELGLHYEQRFGYKRSATYEKVF